MRIELTIERIVLSGVSRAHADEVTAALMSELARVLGQADPATFRPAVLPSVQACTPRTTDSSPATLGAAVGAALGAALTGGGRR
jgi:hypothetical protein